MKLLELYEAYYPFIKGNSSFGCIPETDIREVLCYINDSSWAAIESRNPDIGDPLVPLCQAMLEFDHLPCVTRYALISCLYSLPEVESSPAAVAVLCEGPGWTSNLYRIHKDMWLWSMAETYLLQTQGEDAYIDRYGQYRVYSAVHSRGGCMPPWFKYRDSPTWQITPWTTDFDEMEFDALEARIFYSAYDEREEQRKREAEREAIIEEVIPRATPAEKARVKKGDDL